MRSCYVSIPFGVKPDVDGRALDFDFLYHTVLQPALQELEMECRRLDEFVVGAFWQKALFTALISSDLMIADLSTHNPNVLYELGVRHAMRRGRTLLISAGGRLPGDFGYAQVLLYKPDESGRLTGESAARFREVLQANIRQSQRTTISDSPIYEFFPDFEVILPPELETARRTRRMPPTKARRAFAQSVVESPDRAIGDLEESEAQIRQAPETDPVQYLTLLRRYRDLSQWDRVIALADDAPPDVAASPEVQQLLALALNRRGKSGDRDRAIALMTQLIAETGGDAQTLSILGHIYKKKYETAKARGRFNDAAENLERALQSYRAGFDKNPRDFYPGFNLVTLLFQRDDHAAHVELEAIVPRVRAAIEEKRQAGPLDFWELVTDLELAAVARDWPAAENAASQAAEQVTSGWMVESTLLNLGRIAEKFSHTEDRGRLEQVVGILRHAQAAVEGKR